MQNPALKLIVALVYSVLVAFSKELEYYYLFPILLVLANQKEHIKDIFLKILKLNFFILFLVFFVVFQNSFLALELFFRINLILIFTISLFFSSSYFDIIRGLNTLKIPSVFVSLCYFTIGMIQYLKNEIVNSKNSLYLRGFIPNLSTITYKTFGNFFGMLFIKSIKKSQELQHSLISRGFEGRIFLISQNKVTFFDILVIFTIAFIILLKWI